MSANATVLGIGRTAAAGSASAVLGACMFAGGVLVTPLLALGGEGTALPMALVVAGGALAALLATVLLTRRSAEPGLRPRSHPVGGYVIAMTETTGVASKPLALVTGASSGIGLELARQFADHGFDLMVNAEDAGLAAAAAAAARRGGATVHEVQADLRDRRRRRRRSGRRSGHRPPAGRRRAQRRRRAGRRLLDTDIADEQEIIDPNISSTVRLAKLVLRDMVGRGEGRVLFTSSIASTMPGTFQAVYNASKSFLQSFAEALQEEFKDSGVTITSLMPGPTETNFFHRADMDDTKVGASRRTAPRRSRSRASRR